MTSFDFTKIVIVAGFLIVLLALQVYFKKYGGRLGRGLGADRRIRVLETTMLGPQDRLTLVEADGQRVLVLTGRRGQGAFWPLDANGQSGGQS